MDPRLSPFSRLLAATGISNIGDGVRLVALPLLAIQLTSDPRLVVGAVVADRLPWMLLLLPGGALADRFDRLRLRVRLDWFRAALALGLGMVVVSGQVTLPLLYLATGLMAGAEAIVDSSSAALLPALVDDDDLESGAARLGATEIIGRDLAGPALGGALFAVASGVPFVLDAATFAASAVLATSIRGASRPGPAAEPAAGLSVSAVDMSRSIRDGLTWMWRESLLRSLALLTTALSVSAFALVSVLVVFVTHDLGLGPAAYSALMVASALGGLLGSWLAPRLRHLPLPAVLGAAAFTTGLADVAIARTGWLPLLAILLVVDTAGVLVWNILTLACRQRLIPDELRGRVGASYRFMLALGAPVGALAGGFATHAFGAGTTILASGIATSVLGVLALVVVRPISSPHREPVTAPLAGLPA
jgi:hypothetical protein